MNERRVLVLGASRYHARSIRSVRRMGCWVLAVDRDPCAPGAAEADLFLPLDITDIPACVEAARRHSVRAVLPLSDFGVPTAAAASEALGLRGISVSAARTATNKLLMREAFDRAGIPSVHYRRVEAGEDPRGPAMEIGSWPLVVKPADSRGGGSRGVMIVNGPDELDRAAAFARSFYEDRTLILEERLAGTEHSVELIVSGGEAHVLAVSDKTKLPPPFRVDKSLTYPSRLPPEKLRCAEEIARAAAAAVGIGVGAAHVEVCWTESGPRLFEIGARTGGGAIPEPIVPFVTGVEMLAENVRVLLGESASNLSPERRGACVYRFLTPPPGRLAAVSGLDEIRRWPGILDAEVSARIGERIPPVRVGADRAGFLIAGGENAALVEALADRAERHLEFKVEDAGG